jgi:hypothetical protein
MFTYRQKTYILLFLLFFVSYGYFFQGGGWNQNSRVCLIRSMVHYGTFTIDSYREDSIEPYYEFVNTGDWSYYNGNYYTNKTPGLSFMALIPYTLSKYILSQLIPEDTEKQVLYSVYFSNLLCVALCGVFLCLLMYYVCKHFFVFKPANALALTLYFGFGTLLFSYNTTFYCHVPAAFFSFLSFVLIMHLKHKCPSQKRARVLLAGFSGSMAVLLEPSTIFMLGCIFFYCLSFRDGRKYLIYFLIGCIPPGMLQCLYNLACFGNPLASGYEYANPVIMITTRSGQLFVVPGPRDIFRILFSPNRGLLASSPVLIMALPGIFLLFKQKNWLAEACCCLILAAVFILFTLSYFPWYHASTPGPRYLLPAFPFFFLLTVFALPKFPLLFKMIGLYSIVINLTITLVGTELPHDIDNPLGEIILYHLLQGKASINPVPFSDFHKYPSIYDLANIETWTPNFNSFNLGEILFPHSLISVLPLLLFWLLWIFLIRQRTG